MKKVVLSRAYLETLSFAELVKIADEEGIDVPADFNRNFLIEEIIEVYEESQKIEKEDMILSDDDDEQEQSENILTARAYNQTEVAVVLQNPAWAFVYWNISEADKLSLDKAFISQMRLDRKSVV